MLHGQPFLVEVIVFVDKHMFWIYNDNESFPLRSLSVYSTLRGIS